ncbi:MAG: chromosomal replication initiator protein DnaA [Firmicutes bacterium]|nr:chromosomal replication initiator protein DnaA [Bacillota bacterium]
MSENVEYSEVWEAALKVIERNTQYTETTMNLWFKELKIVMITDTSVVLVAKSDFKRDIVRGDKYRTEIEKALAELLGYKVSVDIRSDQAQSKVLSEIRLQKEDTSFEDNKNSKKTENKIGCILPPDSTDVQKTDEKPANPEIFTSVGDSKIINYADVYKFNKFEYTFETFVVGSSNRFAHSACIAAAADPGGNTNPLLIYGPSGLGKTHLLYAVIDRVQKTLPDKKVVYVKGEDFTNQLIDSISRNITKQFREKYRQTDVLLIDDIQFIAGKVSTQEEFFHTFNALYENNKQIIMTSDRPPREMKTLEERLRTRFESALGADIQPPDMELRMAILKAKTEAVGIQMPTDVMAYIAENLHSNVRQLEGAVRKIAAKSFLSGAPITIDLAIRSISDMLTGSEPVSVTVDKILNLVTKKYGVTVEALKGKGRSSELTAPRHIAIYIIRTMTDMSLPAIGKVFNRDHSTIINSLETVENKIKTNPQYEAEVKGLISELKNR